MGIRFIYFVFILSLTSCLLNSEADWDNVVTTFRLTDTSGVETYSFREGEAFKMVFTVLNSSEKGLSYSTGLPIVSFRIRQKDSLVCSSVDQMGYAGIFITGKIRPDSVFTEIWQAPNTIGREQVMNRIRLRAGFYRAEVLHPSFFNEYKLPQTKALYFEITK